jgi:pilus assembly protein CpaD
MRSKFAILALAAAVSGCQHTKADLPDRGVAATNTPVLIQSNLVFDADASDGSVSSAEQARLDAWFAGLGLGYGDTIYVDGPYADSARADVARVAGKYGMFLSDGAPVTQGAVAPGMVRVVVSRNRAEVPNCPNWSRDAQPNYNNRSMSNYGCGVNSNIAAMVANPADLVHGREGDSVVDARAASRGVGVYYSTQPTGKSGLQSVSTKGQ